MQPSHAFHTVVRHRHSIRSFLPNPVPEAIIRSVADDARHTPSNSNIQPWLVHIVSGAARDALSKAMLDADEAGRHSPDFPWGYDQLSGIYRERQREQGAAYFQALGVPREALDERKAVVRRNLAFFGAPHACLLFMPALYDNVRVAGDVGMYAQTFLLSLTAHGLSGVPQTYLGFFADTIRETLDIDPSLKMLFGISFGYPDLNSQASQYRIEKAPLDETMTFHR